MQERLGNDEDYGVHFPSRFCMAALGFYKESCNIPPSSGVCVNEGKGKVLLVKGLVNQALPGDIFIFEFYQIATDYFECYQNATIFLLSEIPQEPHPLVNPSQLGCVHQ